MDTKDRFLLHKFSIGLPMDTTVSEFDAFLRDYAEYLSSIYFSLPVGRQFYSRTEIENEFSDKNAAKKQLELLKLTRAYGIRTEWAINIYGLREAELLYAAEYAAAHDVALDEIVTLAEYGATLRRLYPQVELKYSFNNPSLTGLDDNFDTVVVGKRYLRDKQMRHQLLSQSKGLVLLLNNGCSFECRYPCGDTAFCGGILQKNLGAHSLDELYAMQSFFPDELLRLIETDPCADGYRWKLSTRPLGIEYTKKVLETYTQLESVRPLILESTDNYGLFCVMRSLLQRRNELHYEEICRIKAQLAV